MKKPTEQPDTDLAELGAKVVELAKVAQARGEELRIKQGEEEVAAGKAEEKKRLKDLFTDGKRFAGWTLLHRGFVGAYLVKIEEFKQACGNTEAYIDFIKSFENKIEGLKKSIRSVRDRMDAIPGIRPNVYKDGCWHSFFIEDDKKRYLYLDLQEQEFKMKLEEKELEAINKRFWVAAHVHMEGFIETMLASNPDTDNLLSVVKVAMVAGTDTCQKFGGRQKVLGYLKTTTMVKIKEKLSSADIDEAGIKEIERILNEVGEAVKQQVKK